MHNEEFEWHDEDDVDTDGYNYPFDVYVGQDDNLADLNSVGKVSGIVLKLASNLFGKGYRIYFDRFYASPNLLYWLRLVDLYGCGTSMTNKGGFPKELKMAGASKQGEFDWLQCQRTGMLATQWHDKKVIYFLSNFHVPEYDGLTLRRHNKKGENVSVACTPTVYEYNKYMGAVDLNDKMCRIDRSRRTYKWYI